MYQLLIPVIYLQRQTHMHKRQTDIHTYTERQTADRQTTERSKDRDQDNQTPILTS